MKRVLLALFLAGVASTLGCADDPSDVPEPGEPEELETAEEAVFQGEDFSRPDVLPLILDLGDATGRCTALVWRGSVVITAAHCVADLEPEAVFIEGAGGFQRAEAIEVHPEYTGERVAATAPFVQGTSFAQVTPDLALVRFPRGFLIGRTEPIQAVPAFDSPIDIVGWGNTEDGLATQSKHARLRYRGSSSHLPSNLLGPELLISAWRFEDGVLQTACGGDSGAPVFLGRNSDRPLGLHVASFNLGGCGGNITNTAVNLHSHRTWIDDTTDALLAAREARYQNPAHFADVNDDGNITPIDALLLIKLLGNRRGGTLTPEAHTLPPVGLYLDPNGDGRLTSNDALTVIGILNNRHGYLLPRLGGTARLPGLVVSDVAAYQRQETGPVDAAYRAFLPELDDEIGFTTAHDFNNWGGRQEKWLASSLGWHFLTPDGRLFRWNGQRLPTGEVDGALVAQLLPEHHATPELVANPPRGGGDDLGALARSLDCANGFQSWGNFYTNYWGRSEKWFYGNSGWHHIYPDGRVTYYLGQEVGTLSPAYYADPLLLVNACQ